MNWSFLLFPMCTSGTDLVSLVVSIIRSDHQGAPFQKMVITLL